MYTKPEFTVERFDVEDVITDTSAKSARDAFEIEQLPIIDMDVN